MKPTTLLLLAAVSSVCAQPPPTVAQAVESAVRNYPSIRVSQEQVAAAAAGIQLARTAYLPRIDALAQVNRATRNNVFGILLPQSTLPSLSGPVIGSNNAGTAWGSAIGTLVTWEPFDFGQRRLSVQAAEAVRAQSEASVKYTEYEIAVATADACMTLAAATETVRAAQAGVDRADVFLRNARALVDAGLRPGADSARAEAELAAARTQAIQAGQAVDVARAVLAQFLGVEPAQAAVAAPGLTRPPAETPAPSFDPAGNPLMAVQAATIEQARAELHALERTYFPRFYLQGAAYARGSGAETDGHIQGGVNGLAPNVQNYALGFSVSFPLFDFNALQARAARQVAGLRAQQARAQQIAAELRGRWNVAVAGLNGARRVAANTPVQVSAARAASEQAGARYQSGLGALDAVAEAQRLLTQAEIDDALARIAVWRSLLSVAAAAGDIRPFLAEVSR